MWEVCVRGGGCEKRLLRDVMRLCMNRHGAKGNQEGQETEAKLGQNAEGPPTGTE